MVKYLAFDIEIAQEIPEDVKDWDTLRPLGISCAALVADDLVLPFWAGEGTGLYTDRMTVEEVIRMTNIMRSLVRAGYVLTTWNGLKFDLDILNEESCFHPWCKEVAMRQIDMMFHFFCFMGYPVGLDNVAKSMGLPGKLEGMTGAKAPTMWKSGGQKTVIEYVIQDCRTTLDVAKEVIKTGSISWKTKAGKNKSWCFQPHRWLTVRECLELSEPDTSWMDEPIRRQSFYEWIGEPNE